ncbi:MAG: glycosyltransferase [Sporolactobacillus sp.]|uniref:glycosyltransferase n=1 Tax=Sporolactobacillus sp. STSJ-5 TaxID=2965076 RepID=UPI0021081C93|nr:glycosyltransferase [Sporolactobacillus sp. STSJ-5]MCQ2009701.1 glycosyltransferase [Sporolactobacillus sp. STSJ-5]
MPRLKIKMTHLERMTDDTGLVEHALGNIPRRSEGYSTDDNARALWLVSEWQKLIAGDPLKGMESLQLRRLSSVYLSFLEYAQQADGHFHNNYAYDRTLEEEQPSEDCLGRSLWACAVACLDLPNPDSRWAAAALFQKAFPLVKKLNFPRGTAYALSAASLLNMRCGELSWTPEFQNFVREETPECIENLEAKLLALFERNSDTSWRWFEPVMTYGNGVLPWALFHSFSVSGNSDTLLIAEESLDFLINKMTREDGLVHPIGNHGWCTRECASQWDQQPLEVMKLALAAEQAVSALSTPEKYLRVLENCRNWFHGANDLHVPVADAAEGGGRDGLEEKGINRNQGAESTIAYLMTELIYWRTLKESKGAEEQRGYSL